MDDRKNTPQNNNVIQNIILESREKLTVTGVIDVLSFDDLIVIIETELRFTNDKRWRFKNK